MTRKSHGLGLAVAAAALSLTFASADLSGAFAHVAESGVVAAAHADKASVSAHFAQEVIEPIAGAVDESNRSVVTTGSLYELVAKTDTGLALSEQMRCLAGAVYFESRGEPLDGQLAVAQVVINRADSRRFPSTYCGVVSQPAQFSFIRDGEMPRINTTSTAWRRARAIARIAHEGMWTSEAQDSLYFHARHVNPDWNRSKTAQAVINRHIFYR